MITKKNISGTLSEMQIKVYLYITTEVNGTHQQNTLKLDRQKTNDDNMI